MHTMKTEILFRFNSLNLLIAQCFVCFQPVYEVALVLLAASSFLLKMQLQWTQEKMSPN